ncbi:MAG: OsmC family protein [Flavobacteriales bacterium]
MIRSSKAIWKGTGKEGKGHLTSTSGVLKDTPYSFHSRFESEDGKAGTNPEELIAAAHAGCFNMKLSFLLGNKGYTPDELDCTSEVKIGDVPGGKGVVGIHLVLKAKVPNISQADFDACAQDAKENCPISQLLKAVPITLSATLAK